MPGSFSDYRKPKTAGDLESAVSMLEKCEEVARGEGNANYSPYMLGYANGIILARSILRGVAPDFEGIPDEFLCDIEGEYVELAAQEYECLASVNALATVCIEDTSGYWTDDYED